MVVRRFDVMLTRLDPTLGSEMRKTRPCVVISPDEANDHLRTAIVAPVTSKLRPLPTRIACELAGKPGQIALDQMRAVDKARLIRKLDTLRDPERQQVLSGLAELFAP